MNRKSEEPLWLYVGKGPGRDLFVRQFLRGLSLLHSGAEAAQGGEAGGSFAGEKAPLAAARAAALRAAAGGWLAAGAALLPPGAAPLRLNSGAA
uniref:hypothetical protein n=1 Tax=Paenibacillus pinistramenti TaxID=1768003 RepID=UPI0011080DDA